MIPENDTKYIRSIDSRARELLMMLSGVLSMDSQTAYEIVLPVLKRAIESAIEERDTDRAAANDVTLEGDTGNDTEK